MIKFLIEKEFKQLLRNSFLPKLILVFPCMIMLLMPWAVNLEIKNIQLNIVDNDHSAISQRLVNKIAASTYFRLVEVPASYEEGLRNIEIGTADIVMEIPRHLERDWMNGEDAHVLIAANAVNGTKGGLGSSYLSSIINDYAAELRSEHPLSLIHIYYPLVHQYGLVEKTKEYNLEMCIRDSPYSSRIIKNLCLSV